MTTLKSEKEIVSQSYLNDLKRFRENFYIRVSNINTAFTYRIANPLVEDLYQLKVNLPDEEFLVEIESEMDLIISEYASVVKGNIVIQEHQIEKLTDGMDIENIKPIKIKDLDMEQRIPVIVKKIVKRIVPYLKELNKNNSIYWQKEEAVKKLVKKIVTAERVGKAIISLDEIYYIVLEEMKQSQEQFISDYKKAEMVKVKVR